MPTTSSTSSPTTGIRENPERGTGVIACRQRAGRRSIETMSVRGTMTSRTRVSPSSKTEWIISRSSSSMTPSRAARSTRSRSSLSLANGPRGSPCPGVTALPRDEQPCASGPSTPAAAGLTARAAQRAPVGVLRGPRARGDADAPRTMTTVMIATAMQQPEPDALDAVETRQRRPARPRSVSAMTAQEEHRVDVARAVSPAIREAPRRRGAAHRASSVGPRSRDIRAIGGLRRADRRNAISSTQRAPRGRSSVMVGFARSVSAAAVTRQATSSSPAARTSPAPPRAPRGRSRAGAACRGS